MRRLAPRQLVTLTLDGEEDSIDCQVRSVGGPVALLDCVAGAPVHLRERLSPGSMCMMAFTFRRAIVGLRGVLTTASDDLEELAFVVADGVQVEERRVAERVALATRARISTIDPRGLVEPPGAEALTADISLGGVLIEREDGAGAGPRFRLELFFGGDPAPVCCDAQLARRTGTHLGLRFTEIEPFDRVRLARILAEHQRRLMPAGNAEPRAAR